jgi:O-acetyl-ADP-ribose deacetylase (regulator of RNase III)
VTSQKRINGATLRLVKCDITDLEVDAFVYYARPDLKLGSGFGTAIAMRGGPSVQEALNEIGPRRLTEAVVTAAGEMKAKFIIHAIGPAFQEEDLDSKLRQTIRNVLKEAEAKGITQIAFPPMGAGFYGVPLADSARITLGTISEYLSHNSNINDIVICLLDNREYQPFHEELARMPETAKETA